MAVLWKFSGFHCWNWEVCGESNCYFFVGNLFLLTVSNIISLFLLFFIFTMIYCGRIFLYLFWLWGLSFINYKILLTIISSNISCSFFYLLLSSRTPYKSIYINVYMYICMYIIYITHIYMYMCIYSYIHIFFSFDSSCALISLIFILLCEILV